jgi:hypothetical protein
VDEKCIGGQFIRDWRFVDWFGSEVYFYAAQEKEKFENPV